MATFEISDNLDAETESFLEQRLIEDSLEKNTPPYEATPLTVLAKSEDGFLLGGLTGKTFWNWLYIDMLWVAKEARHQGLGARLVHMAEEKARQRGCSDAYLWTESFQGPNFYPKLGYQRFVTKEDFPSGHQRIGFMKRLIAS